MNKIGQRTRKLECLFLIAPSRFLADLIKFTVLIFPNSSGRVGKFFPDGGEAEKLAASGKKNQVNTSRGTILREKTKKTLFHYIFSYNYFKESFNSEYHMYQLIPLHSCDCLKKISMKKQTWRLMKEIAEMKSDTEQTMKLE